MAIVYLICDLLWNPYKIGLVHYPRYVCIAINETYFISSVFVTFLFMWYVETNINETFVNHKWIRLTSLIPACIVTILVLSTPWTKVICWLDEEGIYHRGSWAFIHLIVCFLYGCISLLHLIISAFRKENYVYRKEYVSTSLCAGAIIFFNFLQQFIPELPLNAAGMLIGIVVEYTNISESLISLDPLTKINNKNQLFTYIHTKLKNLNEKDIFYLLMIDMDNFKMINDQYGHLEGDQAIIRIADALKLTFSDKNAMISRYGGDEFIVAGECKNIEDIPLLKENFHAILASLNKEARSKYPLTASIGTALWNPSIQTIPDFIQVADQDLYRIKKEKKKGRIRLMF